MAEFPYPEYRNLWPGSALSKDRSMVTESGNVTAEQIEDGLRLTINSVPTTGYTPLDTVGSMRVPISPNTKYHWVTPVRNSGAVPLLARMASWVYKEGGGTENSGAVAALLQPGETAYLRFPNGIDSKANGYRLRWAIYYSTPDLSAQLPAGAVLDILDGITLVEGDTAPDFPFNGDGAKPVETLKRRNLNPDPKGSSIDAYRKTSNDVMTVVTDEGEPAIQLLEGPSPNTTLYIDPNTNWDSSHGLSAGKWFAHSVEVKAVNGLTNTSPSIARIMAYRGGEVGTGGNSTDYELAEDSYKRVLASRPVTAAEPDSYFRTLMWPSAPPGEGAGHRVRRWVVAVADTQSEAEAAVATYFDGDTAPSGNLSYRWAPDGTSLEIETIQPPTGRTTVWDGEPYKSTSTLWVGDSAHATGVMDVGIATEARLGIVADVYSRSREKIQLELARVDSQLIAGERVELDAAAMTASPVVWHWRQITGPTVVLEPHEASLDFIAPDVDEDTTVRIAVYAASEDGRNRSDWHYFDLTIKPPMARFRASGSLEFEPVSPKYVGYDRGKREIWNDVIPPSGFSPTARHEAEIIDLGILPDDVQFTTGGPPEVAAAGGIYVDLETGDIYRNFGAGYNETDDTTAAPRTNAWWVNPATGDILEWIED